jgi:two-component system, NtrC family, sensor histidine kinase PilS
MPYLSWVLSLALCKTTTALVRLAIPASEPAITRMLTPHRLVRWVFVGRLSLASAIFIAAIFVWNSADTDPGALLVASLAFSATLIVTVGSVWYSEIYRRPLGSTFYYLQTIFDLALVTAAVHVTGGGSSQFAALYILVIAAASLLLPVGGGLLVAALGNVLYIADVIYSPGQLTASVWLQLIVFALVALGSAYVGARMQEAGADKEALAAELVRTRIQATDILHTIRSGILTVDADGNLLYANPTAERLLGLDLEPLLGRRVLRRIEAASPELADALAESVARRTRTSRLEGEITNGTRRFPVGIATTYSEVAGGKGYRSATAIFQDISDQKRLETLRLRAERLEGVAALSAALAHEIKNPLAAIRSAAEQLGRMPRVSDDERTLTGLVARESDRLSRLLSEFLDFARVRVTRTERVTVAAIVRGAAALASAHPDCAEGVHVSCTLEDENEAAEGDEDLLHRAVFNLVLNAVQMTAAGGEVRIAVSDAHAHAMPGGVGRDLDDAIAIRVIDQGPGIPPDIRDQLFDPFFTTREGGSGLGLAVVHRAIEAHRGVVLVDADDRGTCFTILLPRHHARRLTPTGILTS